MPFPMSIPIQSVLVQGTLYVGGGHTDNNNEYIVMAYGISAGKWAMLPPYSLRLFAMTAIDNHLVLVGGRRSNCSPLLGVWSEDSKKWTHPYPDMTTPRYQCSAVVYKQYLVVAGGMGPTGLNMSSVEIMNTDNESWYAGSQTPIAWRNMKTAVVGDTCYSMGGLIEGVLYTNKVYSVSLPALVSQLSSDSSAKDTQPWKELPPLPVTRATPLSTSGTLLAVGGKGEDGKAVRLYQPDTGKWVKVADMPTTRHSFTCTMITDKELLVAGGWCKYCLATTYIAQIR